jgi:hypothetical protein
MTADRDFRYVKTPNGWKWVPAHIAKFVWAHQRRARSRADAAQIAAITEEMKNWRVA